MKINYPKIQKAISFNPTNAHRKMNIVELSELIKNNDLLVPCFKEQVQFNDSQVISLLHCELFSKAPIASLSFNKIGSNDEVKQFSFVAHREVNGSHKGKLSLIDGHRRLMINYAIYNDCDCIVIKNNKHSIIL